LPGGGHNGKPFCDVSSDRAARTIPFTGRPAGNAQALPDSFFDHGHERGPLRFRQGVQVDLSVWQRLIGVASRLLLKNSTMAL
jgi:hypothetical protein